MRGLLRLFVLCLVLTGAVPALAQTDVAERRVALVIGNAAYKTGPLANPVNDAKDMASALRAVGFTVIDRYDASARDMKRAIGDFGREVERGGVGLFFFAGHGVQIDGHNYLLPVDAEIDREEHVESEAIDAQQVLGRMAGARNRLNIVILDACRNNPYASKFRAPSRGLAVTPAPSGTYIAYATAPGEVAADGSGRNGVFTRAVLDTMKEPGVELDTLFKTVRGRVSTATGGRQVPWTSSSVTGDFYLRPAAPGTVALAVVPPSTPSAPVPTAPSFDPRQADVAFWQSIQVSTNVADFEDYLKQFPKGQFRSLATRRRDALRQQQVAAAPPPPPAAAPAARPVQPAVGVYPQGSTPGTVFRDCPECPEMVGVPAGSFMMGSPENEVNRFPDEGPLHRVTISRSFSVGKYEVTFDQWDACVAQGGCGGYRPVDGGWGRGARPVINVSWDDAKAYVDWLSRKTGRTYRLLSEAEWEYSARGGTTTAWACGAEESCIGEIAWGWSNSGRRSQVVGGKRANAFGLHDMTGTVWEWVEDCWHESYAGAPGDGGVRTTGGSCGQRVLRGGSWGDDPGILRAASRYRVTTGYRDVYAGFRVARTD